MGYTIPLRFVRVSKKRTDNRQFDVAICATRIVAMMSTEIYQARRTLTAEKKAGTLINAAGIEKSKTVIFLDNGSVVSSPLSVARIMSLIERAEQPPEPQKSKRMKTYTVFNKEPEETEDEFSMEAEFEDFDDDEEE